MKISDDLTQRVKMMYEKYPYPLYQYIVPEIPNNMERFFKMLDIPQESIKSLIDCGCGTGGNLVAAAIHFPYIQCIGFDMTKTSLTKSNELIQRKKIKNAKTIQANLLEGIPLVDGQKYDSAFCTGVINHVLDPITVLKNIAKALNPGAPFVIVCYGEYGWVRRKQLISLVRKICDIQNTDPEELYHTLVGFSEYIEKIFEKPPIIHVSPYIKKDKKTTICDRLNVLFHMPPKVSLRKIKNKIFNKKIDLNDIQIKANLIDLILNPQILTFNDKSIKKMVKEAGLEFVAYLKGMPSPRECIKDRIILDKVEKLEPEAQLNFIEEYLQTDSYMFGVRVPA